MFHSLRYLRGYVYPRGQLPRSARSGSLRGSDAILGMTVILLAVVGIAFAIEMVFF